MNMIQNSQTQHFPRFSPANYTNQNLTINGQTVRYRMYSNLSYTAFPADPNYQYMNLYIPQAYYENHTINGYTAQTAPIFLPNTVGGYAPGRPAVVGYEPFREEPIANAAFTALLKGYVVAAAGVRGRGLTDKNGRFTGCAPACILDLKAAIRYLRHIKDEIPGDTDKIISNGTSAGGALSALLGATGNHPDYDQALKAMGAANTQDHIFAASCYCPITNLDHGDMAYEWMFHHEHSFHALRPCVDESGFHLETVNGQLNEHQIALSQDIRRRFPAYLNSLRLTDKTQKLTLDENGDGSFKDYIQNQVTKAARQAVKNGQDLSGLSWITWTDGLPSSIDFDGYVSFITRMKPVFAFDDLEMNTPENELFGTPDIKCRHFSRDISDLDPKGPMADSMTIKMMNPMNYIDDPAAHTAAHWRIRHGCADRDTALPIPVMLAKVLEKHGADVDFALPWGIPHSGDYDLDLLFDWADRICKDTIKNTKSS